MIITAEGLSALLIAARAAAEMEQLYLRRRGVEHRAYAEMHRRWH